MYVLILAVYENIKNDVYAFCMWINNFVISWILRKSPEPTANKIIYSYAECINFILYILKVLSFNSLIN